MLVFVVIIIVTGISSCYIVGFFFNWKITLLGLAFLPFILFCTLYKSHLQAELDRSKEEVRRDSNIIVAETLIDIKTVTALNVSN
jgi:ABC-type bacteriocin/lantibiotic exporter with double-glycine peptidase domain